MTAERASPWQFLAFRPRAAPEDGSNCILADFSCTIAGLVTINHCALTRINGEYRVRTPDAGYAGRRPAMFVNGPMRQALTIAAGKLYEALLTRNDADPRGGQSTLSAASQETDVSAQNEL